MKTNVDHALEAPHSALRSRFWPSMAEPVRPVPAMATCSDLDSRPAFPSAGTQGAVYRCSPREMAELSLDLFLAGVLTDEEYELLAFQPELHPDFDRTIGALTGEQAKPDQTRDYVASWRDRLEFERSRARPDPNLIERIQRILFVLRRLGTSGEISMFAR